MRLLWPPSLALLAVMGSRAVADVVLSASNTTTSTAPTTSPIDVAIVDSSNNLDVFDQVQPLGVTAVSRLPALGLKGPLFAGNPSTMNNFTSDMIAYISCDAADYTGYILASEVFDTALTANVTAILLYSRVAEYCNIASIGSSYAFVYSMTRANSSSALLSKITASTVIASVTFANEINKTAGSASSSSTSKSSQSSPLGASPTTAVAMIILYSITGIITALFLAIIITGAVRAHRHPERYGPRNILGRQRQSRAKGLGRAMLDTIPIVKFGEHTVAAKPTDVELAEPDATSIHGTHEQIAVISTTLDHENPHDDGPRRSTQSARSGIAAANASLPSAEAQSDEAIICSICTDDFEMGQDLRVLPCDHKFHPACIDPWLLNVSGTCPLCRIDLNPPRSASSAGTITNEGPEGAETSDLPPPLQGPVNVTRITMRQSFLIGLGMGRHDYSNREQRLAAVRRVREQQEEAPDQPQAAEGEGRRRRRFRERFGIRTSRRGEEAEAETEAADPELDSESLGGEHTARRDE